MKTIKKLASILLLALLSIGLTGCYDVIYLTSDSDTASTSSPVSPYNENAKTKSVSAVCYFGYSEIDDATSLEYLVAETHTIEYTSGNYEKTLLNELVIGPDQKGKQIVSLIPKGTTFKVFADDKNRYITVIVSSAFLSAPSTFPTDWSSRSEYVARYNRIKRLAVYSIVDTLTESGKYDRVQVLIDKDGTGVGQIPTRGEFGFTDNGNQNEVLEALYRSTYNILTPENMVENIMYYIKKRSYENLYALITLVDLDDNKKPTQEEVIKSLDEININIVSYDASNAIISPDGSTATVILNAKVEIGTGTNKNTKYFTNTTVRLVNEDGLWKIQYNDLINYFTN